MIKYEYMDKEYVNYNKIKLMALFNYEN